MTLTVLSRCERYLWSKWVTVSSIVRHIAGGQRYKSIISIILFFIRWKVKTTCLLRHFTELVFTVLEQCRADAVWARHLHLPEFLPHLVSCY